MLDVPTDRDSLLVTGLHALSDFAGRATMSDKEIDKERGVVMEEWRLGRGADERMQRQAVPGHLPRLALRAFGCRSASRRTSRCVVRARLRAFYHDWYRPEWMAVIAVGDVDPDKMERLIREQLLGPSQAHGREGGAALRRAAARPDARSAWWPTRKPRARAWRCS